MTITDLLRFALALLLVIGLVLGLGRGLRRFGPGRGDGTARRIGVVAAASLDTRRRLVLIHRDDVEHLLLIGPGQESVIETGIRPAGSRPAGSRQTPGRADPEPARPDSDNTP